MKQLDHLRRLGRWDFATLRRWDGECPTETLVRRFWDAVKRLTTNKLPKSVSPSHCFCTDRGIRAAAALKLKASCQGARLSEPWRSHPTSKAPIGRRSPHFARLPKTAASSARSRRSNASKLSIKSMCFSLSIRRRMFSLARKTLRSEHPTRRASSAVVCRSGAANRMPSSCSDFVDLRFILSIFAYFFHGAMNSARSPRPSLQGVAAPCAIAHPGRKSEGRAPLAALKCLFPIESTRNLSELKFQLTPIPKALILGMAVIVKLRRIADVFEVIGCPPSLKVLGPDLAEVL